MIIRERTDPRRHNLPTFMAPNVLLVEGPDEYDFIRFLRKRNDLQIHAYEGKNQIRLEVGTILGVEGFDKVRRAAVLRDADDDPKVALTSTLSQVAAALKLKSTPTVEAEQWFPDNDGREWSVWIMPDSASKGDLESLLWRAVKPSDHTTCVEKLLECLNACSPVPIGAQSKAQLYSWLATQREPIRDIYAAFDPRNSLFDSTDPTFKRFADLVDRI